MSNVQSYNALIDRFHAFASGHFILKRFSHGQIEVSDLEKFGEYPFMHVVPSNVSYAKGMKTFSFQIVLADLPRDKEDKPEYQREVLSDLQRIAEDLVAEITNHRMLFGDLITVQNVSLEPFLEEFQHTLTGWTISLDLLVPYYWDACSIPAEWNDFFESGSGGTGSILTFIDSITRDENGNVSLVNDEETPAPNYYYGTNNEGVRGWYLLEGGGLTCETIGDCQTIIDIEAAIDALEEEIVLKADITSISVVGFSNDYNDLDNLPTIPTATSDLTNDGADGVNPFITAADVPAQVNADWNATSGVAEILNKPTIPAAQIQSDWNQSNNTALDFIKNKPTIPDVSGFVPYTGATTDVDLGTHNLTADHIALNVSPSGAGYVVGATEWNNTIGSSQTLLKGGSVSLKNGVDLVARVVNKVTPNTTLTKAAYQAVRVSGAQGQRLAVELAQANNDNNSADTIGLVCETIATNQEGFIQTVGQLESINTTGSLQGETWADGDVLYLSPTTAGALTNIKPTGATGHIVVIGYVEYAHANNGKIYVKIMNGWELDELHNVYISSPANNEVLTYESSTSLWKNKTVATALGFTPVTNARTISTTAPLSGGGDLSANRTLSIPQATTSVSGYLSATDWTTFNGKQAALGFTPEDAANKQNSLAVDGTGVKFPTVDAVNSLSMIDKGKRMVSFFTDFLTSATLDGGQSVTSNGSSSIVTGGGIPNRTNQQGVIAFQTLTSSAFAYVTYYSSGGNQQLWFGGGAWNFETLINISALSTLLERYRLIFGFGSVTTNAAETDGVFITYDEGGTANGTAASANWQCVTVANSVRTLTTTTTAVTAAAWNKLRIEVNAAGTSVTFYVNGTAIATHTTNIPLPSNSRYVHMKMQIAKQIGLTSRALYCDYVGYENILTTPRT